VLGKFYYVSEYRTFVEEEIEREERYYGYGNYDPLQMRKIKNRCVMHIIS